MSYVQRLLLLKETHTSSSQDTAENQRRYSRTPWENKQIVRGWDRTWEGSVGIALPCP